MIDGLVKDHDEADTDEWWGVGDPPTDRPCTTKRSITGHHEWRVKVGSRFVDLATNSLRSDALRLSGHGQDTRHRERTENDRKQ